MSHTVAELREALHAEAEAPPLRLSLSDIRARSRRRRRRRGAIGMAALCVVMAGAVAVPVVLAGQTAPVHITAQLGPPPPVPIRGTSPTRADPIRTGVRLQDGRELVLYYGASLVLGERDDAGEVHDPTMTTASIFDWVTPSIFDSTVFTATAADGSTVVVGGINAPAARITAVVDGREGDVGYVRVGERGGLFWVTGVHATDRPGTLPKLRAYDVTGALLDSIG